MKSVILIRHGKSDWKAGTNDKYRPLNERGVKDADAIAKAMTAANFSPQFIFHSSAKRTKQTASLLVKHMKLDKELLIPCPELYLCQPDAIYDLIEFAPDKMDEIAIVAHNPSITEVASTFSQKGNIYMTTLAVLKLDFDTDDWSKVSKENLVSEVFFYPKKFVGIFNRNSRIEHA